MRHPFYLLPALLLAGCATAPAPEPEPPAVPVIVVTAEPVAPAKPAEAAPAEEDPESEASAKAAEIAAALAELEVSTLSALGGDGPPLAGVLSGSDVPAGLLDAAASSSAGSGALQPGALQGGALRPGAGGARGGGAAAAGSLVSPRRPRPPVPAGWVVATSSVRGGKVANAAQVVARLHGRFRACYRLGLRKDPAMAGSLSLVAALGPNGEVLSVSGGTTTSLKPIVPCLKAVVSGGGFAPPQGGNVSVGIALTFKPQP